jgi:hypothetical protein
MFRRVMAPSAGETNIKYPKESTIVRKQAPLLHKEDLFLFIYVFIYLFIYLFIYFCPKGKYFPEYTV